MRLALTELAQVVPPSMLAGVVRKIAVKHGAEAAEEVATFLGQANPRVAGVMRVRLETAKAAARTAEQERAAREKAAAEKEAVPA